MITTPHCAICGELSSPTCSLHAVRLPVDGTVLLCETCSNEVAQLLIDGKEIALEALRTAFKKKAPEFFTGLGRIFKAYRAAATALRED